MKFKFIFPIVFLFFSIPGKGQDSSIPTKQSGIDFDLFSFLTNYPSLRTAAWWRIPDQRWLQVEVGYGWSGLTSQASFVTGRNPFGSTYQKFLISGLYFKNFTDSEKFWFYGGIGPYFEQMSGELGNNYFFDSSKEKLTVHHGADFRWNRYGVIPALGIRYVWHPVTLDIRCELRTAYHHSRFKNVVDPLVLTNFTPNQVSFHQREVSSLNIDPVLTVRLGFIINRTE